MVINKNDRSMTMSTRIPRAKLELQYCKALFLFSQVYAIYKKIQILIRGFFRPTGLGESTLTF